MEIKGNIKKIYIEFREACKINKFDLNKEYCLYIVEDKAKTPEEIRRIEANNKYWALLQAYVKWHKQCGYTQQHNQLLAEYSPILTEKGEDGKPHKKWVLKKADFKWDKQMDRHYKPTGKFTKDEYGNEYQAFYEIKSSHEMTIEEFGMLLDGLINEIEGSDAPIDCHKETNY